MEIYHMGHRALLCSVFFSELQKWVDFFLSRIFSLKLTLFYFFAAINECSAEFLEELLLALRPLEGTRVLRKAVFLFLESNETVVEKAIKLLYIVYIIYYRLLYIVYIKRLGTK